MASTGADANSKDVTSSCSETTLGRGYRRGIVPLTFRRNPLAGLSEAARRNRTFASRPGRPSSTP